MALQKPSAYYNLCFWGEVFEITPLFLKKKINKDDFTLVQTFWESIIILLYRERTKESLGPECF